MMTETKRPMYPKLVRYIETVAIHFLVLIVVTLVAFPMYWMIITSFKSPETLYVNPPTLLPTSWTLSNYRDLFTVTDFATYFKNSVVVALISTVLSLFIGSIGAYSLSRFRYRGISTYSRVVLLVYMLPTTLIVIPIYGYIVRMGLADSLMALIIANSTFTLPFTLWLMRSYFNSIPISLEESAMIDGCSRLQALFRVSLPIAMPGLVSVGVFSFVNAWNEFLFALVFTSSEVNKTLPIGLSTWVGQDNASWGMLLAASVLVTLPVLAVYTLVQKKLVVGLSDGGVKGG